MLKTGFLLNTGALIPSLGFGTWQLIGEECYQAVSLALETGYRHLDTAAVYDNHREVGKAIAGSGIKREEIFVTSKVWRTEFATDDTISAGRQALEELELTYLDLYLMHWPNRSIPVEDTLKGLEKLKQEGLIKAYGVSNFTIHHLEDALNTEYQISNNQVEYHPTLNQTTLKEYCDKHRITLTAYSPIAQGRDLTLAVIQKLAEKYDRSASQIVLNWLISKGIIAIPRSANPKHIRDNFKTLEWQLETEDIAAIDAVNGNNRIGIPPFSEFDY